MTQRSRLLIVVAMTICLCTSSTGLLLNASAQSVPVEQTSLASIAIPTVQSEHPYRNNEDASWSIPNNSGQPAARIHFSRIELEQGVDQIEIRDAEDNLIQEITASAPEGLWSDMVPGASIKVSLKTDGSGQFWGFSIDQMEPVVYTTLGYSPHPYPNNSSAEKTFINSTSSPAGTRVRFDRVELEDGVDYLVIKDLDDIPYQWITGSHPGGFTSKAVPGAAVKVQLVSDRSGQMWGYNVAEVQNAPSEAPDMPPLRTALAESNHPYVTNFSRTWILTNPDVGAVSSKVHFSRIEVGGGDVLQVLDAADTVIQTFGERTDLDDVWSDYVPGRVVKLKLTTSWLEDWWGFQADALMSSVPNPGLAESNHPYSTNITKVVGLC